MKERCGVSGVFCLAFFLIVIAALLSGCDLEGLAESSGSSSEVVVSSERSRDGASLDRIEELRLKEFEEYYRRPAQKDSWSHDDLKYWDKHYEVWNWAENKRCREEASKK